MFRVENGKANMAPGAGTSAPQKATWRRVVGVPLGNATESYPFGDDVGVVETWEWPDAFAETNLADLKAVQDRLAGGEWRASEQANGWAGRAVAEVLGLDKVLGLDIGERGDCTRDQKAARARVRTMLHTWKRSGALVEERWKDRRNGRETGYLLPGELVTAEDLHTSRGWV